MTWTTAITQLIIVFILLAFGNVICIGACIMLWLLLKIIIIIILKNLAEGIKGIKGVKGIKGIKGKPGIIGKRKRRK